MPKRFIFCDGQVIAAEDKTINKLSPGRLTGEGAFETMRAYRGRVFLLQKHVDRLFSGLKTLKLSSPYPKKKIIRSVEETLQRNRLKNARIRLIVWKGKKSTHIAVTVLPYQPPPAGKYKRGFATTSTPVSQNGDFRQTTVKSIDRRLFAKIYQKAAAQGRDEVLLVNKNGDITEGTFTNIFFAAQGILCTPSLKGGGLNGITRQAVLKLARQNRTKAKIVKADLNRLLDCDEAFLTNSLIEIMPLTSLDGRRINRGKVGPITAELSKRYRKLTLKSSCP